MYDSWERQRIVQYEDLILLTTSGVSFRLSAFIRSSLWYSRRFLESHVAVIQLARFSLLQSLLSHDSGPMATLMESTVRLKEFKSASTDQMDQTRITIFVDTSVKSSKAILVICLH